ncbi:XdhC family protein [Psychrobacter sp. M13]|uniref:XdhC family protein n=1 Tax=Psychrobacter sp. M13 TaxID=3067275 RepID=UPI00273B0909|nr:XdhC/CoxI family protein [Psychrobacter sp. M13]WLP93922.1 XdhC family protein [Psychrobacter sp. M13]
MNQIADILKLAGEAAQQNVDAVLATVVRTEGSAYRRAGAMMLICADGRSVGMISGGCLEPHIIKRAFWLTRNGANVQVYQTGDEQRDDDSDSNTADGLEIESEDELNFGLGCNGKVHVLFERLTSANPLLNLITQVRQNGQPTTIATLIKSEPLGLQNIFSVGARISLGTYNKAGQVRFIGSEQYISNSPILINTVKELSKHKLKKRNTDYVILNSDLESRYLEGSHLESNHENIDSQEKVPSEWLLQCIEPQKRLLICGAGNDVMPLVVMAKLQDWQVTVIDSRAQYATSMRFPQADVVQCVSLEDSKTLLELSDNAAIALMSHSLSQDRARLNVLLEHADHYQYLGQLGPRYRTERLINEVSNSKSNPDCLTAGIKKLHYPIGLKLGGDGPEALALSIMAQVSAVMNEQVQPVPSINNKSNLQLLAKENFTHHYTNDYAHD